MYQFVRYLGGHRERVPWFTAGQVLNLSDLEGTAFATGLEEELSLDEEQVALTPGGGSVSLLPGETPRFLALDEQGFYEVRHPGTDPARPFTVALNVEVAGSELAAMDPAELAASVSPRGWTPRLGPQACYPRKI